MSIHSEHHWPLAYLLQRRATSAEQRRIHKPILVARKVSALQETFLPTDAFWLLRPHADDTLQPCVIRMRLIANATAVQLDVLAATTNAAEQVINQLVQTAATHSIYRNQLLRLVVTPELPDAFGDEPSGTVDLQFYTPSTITDADIVLEPALQELLEHTIIDFHKRRTQLMELGLPGRRGVLFYGPPGTGKTYTCKYLAHRLGATTIVATGHVLLQMQGVCAVARMLQPTLVLLEDVDLVFADRTINPHSATLGEFIDQLDGFGELDQVIFILTTNAIERVEAAIKDRPGRVSQCIYFGPPSAALRRRHLTMLLQPYDHTRVDLLRIVEQTEGVSQAFLKEMVFRAVQLATEGQPLPTSVVLITKHLEEALRAMIASGGNAGKRIIGFQVEM